MPNRAQRDDRARRRDVRFAPLIGIIPLRPNGDARAAEADALTRSIHAPCSDPAAGDVIREGGSPCPSCPSMNDIAHRGFGLVTTVRRLLAHGYGNRNHGGRAISVLPQIGAAQPGKLTMASWQPACRSDTPARHRRAAEQRTSNRFSAKWPRSRPIARLKRRAPVVVMPQASSTHHNAVSGRMLHDQMHVVEAIALRDRVDSS